MDIQRAKPMLLLALAAALAAPTGAAAQGAEPDDELLKRIEALERLVELQARELHELGERQPDSQARAAEPAVDPAPLPKVRPVDATHYLPSRSWAGGRLHYGGDQAVVETHGFVDLEYIDAEPQGSRNGVSTFDNHHANLFFTTRLNRRLLGHVEVEYEHAGDTVEIDQAFMSLRAADWLNLEAGRFYTPFGIERFAWYSPTNPLVSRPLTHRVIVPGNFYAQGLKLSGLIEQGGRPRFSYEVALTDGLGDAALTNRRGSRQTRDNNSSRAVSGRASVIVWPRIEAGASYHWQRYATLGDSDLRFFGLDVSARWSGFELRAERVSARIDDPQPGATPLRQNGWYSQLSYTQNWSRELLPSLSWVGRYEILDLDQRESGNDDQRLLSLGVNAMLVDHARLKLEYQLIREDGEPKRDDTFLGQLVLDF